MSEASTPCTAALAAPAATVRRRRRARRSSCAARIILGADDAVVDHLESDDDTFFGVRASATSSSDSSASSPGSTLRSSADESAAEPQAKIPRTANWSDSDPAAESDSDTELDSGGTDSASESELGLTLADIDSSVAKGCGCANHNHFTVLPAASVLTINEQIKKSSSHDKDAFLIGVLTGVQREESVSHAGQATNVLRTRRTFAYSLEGHQVCRTVFCSVYGIGLTRLKRLQKLVEAGVCIPHPHGNTGKIPWNQFNGETICKVEEFIKNYASVYGLPMPAAPRGRAQTAPTYLPASCTYQSVWAQYSRAQGGGADRVSERSFRRIWRKRLPHVQIMSPRIDVCAKCEQLRDAIKHATSVLFRVNDFGIINEAGAGQVHHLYHEGQTIAEDNGKSHGPNCVVSMLHRYLQNTPHSKHLHGHCDNCCGQNKNKTVMAYLCWRVLVGLEEDIMLSFMVVGHTRCTVDGGFGVIKKKFRASDTDTVSQLVQLVDSSGHRNSPAFFDWEWRCWDDFLKKDFKKVDGITSYQHFQFSKEFPGKVKMWKLHNSDEVKTLQLVKNPQKVFQATDLPPVLPPAGLSVSRRKYLQDQVMPFCRLANRQAFAAMLQ